MGIRQFSCYLDKCYIGKLYLNSNGEKKFITENMANYTEGAKNFIKYTPLATTSDIDAFISERVISRTRPDCSIWLSMIGCSPEMSDEEIFIRNHGRGINDLFNMNEDKV